MLMAISVLAGYATGSALGWSIRRMADGLQYDFSTATFSATPTTPVAAIAEATSPYLGSYLQTIASTPLATWPNGEYAIRVHNNTAGYSPASGVVGILSAVMYNGDAAVYFPSGGSGGSSADPWLTALPGAYASGQAGFIVGSNLDAAVASRLAASAIALNSAGAVAIDQTQPLVSTDAGTVAGALAGSWVNAFGNVASVGNLVTLRDWLNATLSTLQFDNVNAATSRTRQS